MDFNIVPYLGNVPLALEDITVSIPPGFEEFVDGLVLEVRKFTQISSPAEEQQVTNALGRVSAALGDIESKREVAVGPINATKNTIQEMAATVSAPLLQEKARLGELLDARIASEQARREAIKREPYEEKERLIAARNAEILRLQEEQQKLMIDARNNEDLFEIRRLRKEADRLEEEAKEAEYQRETLKETVIIDREFDEPLLKGGRVTEHIDVDIAPGEGKELFIKALYADLISARPIGLAKGVTITIDKHYYKSLVKERQEKNKGKPGYSVSAEFADIGLEAKIYKKVSVPKTARVTRQ
jgi:hypothetical protein